MREPMLTDELEVRIEQALERRPAVKIPADFAARVATKAQAQRVAEVTTPQYGMLAVQGAMVLLVAGLVGLSRDRSTVGVALQWMLCAELAGLAVWRWGLGKMLLPAWGRYPRG